MSRMSFARVTTLLLLSRVAGYVLAFLNSILLARVLGAERLGEYAYAMGIAAVFGLLPNLGISTVVTRSVARDPDGTTGVMKPARLLQAMLATVVLIVIILFAAMLPTQPVPLMYIALAAGQLALGSLSWPYLAVVSGYGRYDRVAWAELAGSVTSTVLLTTAVLLSGEVAVVLGSHVVAAGVAIVSARLAAGPLLKPHGKTAVVSMRALLRDSLPFGATAAVQSLYTRIDILLLGQLGTTVLVGLYSAAYKPITLAVYLGGTVAGALFPFLAQATGELPPAFMRTVRTLTTLGPAMALVLTGLSGQVLTVLYGPAFGDAGPILAVLAWSVVANWLYAPLGVAMQATGQERTWLIVLTGGLLLNVVGNLVAIPRWGGVGAAGATVLSEALVLISALVLSTQRSTVAVATKGLIVAVVAAAAGGTTLWFCAGWGPLGSTVASVAVYGSLLALARQITSDDAAAIVGWVRQSVWYGSRG
jgi:O-antigen/teichoic acid export membrane protein